MSGCHELAPETAEIKYVASSPQPPSAGINYRRFCGQALPGALHCSIPANYHYQQCMDRFCSPACLCTVNYLQKGRDILHNPYGSFEAKSITRSFESFSAATVAEEECGNRLANYSHQGSLVHCISATPCHSCMQLEASRRTPLCGSRSLR